MAVYNKFQSFVEALAEKKHNLGSDTLMVALTNTAPANTNSVLADIAQIDYTNLSARALTISSSAQTGGTYALALADLTLTAVSGAVGPFRYIVIYNDTATNDELIAWFDYGASITMAQNETLLLDFQTNLLTLA